MSTGPFVLDPDAVLDYTWDWTAWLADGETITSHEIIPEAITIDSSTHTGTAVTAWVSAAERRARATCRITTSQGRTDDRTLTFTVTDR